MLPFPGYLVLVLSLRWPLDKALQLWSTSVHCCLHFVSTYGLESQLCFLMHCATPYLPGAWLVTRQMYIDLCDLEKLHCLGVGGFFIIFIIVLPLLGHRSHPL